MYKINNFTYNGIMPKNIFNLTATCQKSFYGKAIVIEDQSGIVYLRSYNTIVRCINKDGKFIRLWSGYSDTTKRHINDFCKFYNLPGFNKKEWLQLEVENIHKIIMDNIIDILIDNQKKGIYYK